MPDVEHSISPRPSRSLLPSQAKQHELCEKGRLWDGVMEALSWPEPSDDTEAYLLAKKW